MPHTIEEKLAILDDSGMKGDVSLPGIAVDPREVPRYGLPEVALFLHVPENTLRSWVSGRTFPTITGEAFSGPLIEPADPSGNLLSFYNLIEAHILKSTRQRDEVPMKFIRQAIDYVTEQFPSPHPLITQKFETDGRFLFIRRVDDLINASKMGQFGIEPILRDYLSRIDRDTQGMPVTLYPVIPGRPGSKAVAIKYGVSSGAPVLTGTGILISVLWGRYQAGDTSQDLVEDYDQPKDKIEDAIAYLEAA
jgi:uncharacterized protein (DUF433 family)